MTNNTEPLKVGDECREAFELDWMHAQEAADAADGESLDEAIKRVAWHFYQAAWNRRTEPSPAEVSSEGWPEPEIFDMLAPKESSRGYSEAQVKEIVRQALSQQSPAIVGDYSQTSVAAANVPIASGTSARVEGELTDDEALKLWIETQLTSVYPVDTKEFKGLFARAIERALNQRLAVKEGEAVACMMAKQLAESLHKQHFATSAPNWEPCDTIAGLITQIDNMTCRLVSTHPVSDDQQAKDAALEKLMVELLSLGSNADRASSYEETCAIDDRISYVKAQIRALSTTKQEEV